MKRYSKQEVARHNQKTNCWVIVKGKIYNVTELIDTHSGGSDKIIPFCGQDATKQFTLHDHSDFAKKQLENYLVGELADD